MRTLLVSLVALALSAVPSLSQAGAFMFIPNVPGESTDENHRQWIDLSEFAFGVDRAYSQKTGVTTADRQMKGCTISKSMDMASMTLAQAICDGVHFRDVIIDFVKPDGNGGQVLYMQIEMKQVYITSYSVNGSGLDDGSIPTETLSLNFDKIVWKYFPIQSPDPQQFETTWSDK